jgi:hypothetical protein
LPTCPVLQVRELSEIGLQIGAKVTFHPGREGGRLTTACKVRGE